MVASKHQLRNRIQNTSTIQHIACISSLKAQSPQGPKAKEEKEEQQRRKANLTEWPGS